MSDTRERCVHGWVDPMEWCTSCMAARIAELEAQVRERDEALKNERAAHRERIVELEREFREEIQSAIAEYRWSREENQGW